MKYEKKATPAQKALLRKLKAEFPEGISMSGASSLINSILYVSETQARQLQELGFKGDVSKLDGREASNIIKHLRKIPRIRFELE